MRQLGLPLVTPLPQKVTETEFEAGAYYLSHRAVFKISETTKIRPVFDATAREGNNPSLNDCLLRGSNLIELIPDILDRFRMYPIGLSADIETAFLQLTVTPEHRDFLRFFYPHENNEIVYRHCRLVFGVCSLSSPFLLAASINHLLDNTPSKYMDIVSKLSHSFYVDNCVTGVSDTRAGD
ncbi:integrase catalytic domain-containing protein [Trichonephila inaurata madagascariensis]|uniref:Integrase catalytic domain-containing protein n=1 Tax=Trichonephila inaurata madagascariensis TaxID=2747483 RepID=A0A8X7C6M1_9ARAC|nr:integrase catalytic domain-containing protein [Trichonephila inaurata madagascariensis]